MEQMERSNSNEAQMHTTSANEQLHLAFAKTKFNGFHLLAKLNTYLPCPKAPGVFRTIHVSMKNHLFNGVR